MAQREHVTVALVSGKEVAVPATVAWSERSGVRESGGWKNSREIFACKALTIKLVRNQRRTQRQRGNKGSAFGGPHVFLFLFLWGKHDFTIVLHPTKILVPTVFCDKVHWKASSITWCQLLDLAV